MATDREVLDAIGAAKAERRHQQSIERADRRHKQALRRRSQSKRAAKEVVSYRTQQTKEAANARAAAATSVIAAREQAGAQRRANVKFEKQRATRRAVATDLAVSTIPSGDSGGSGFSLGTGLFSTVLWLMFGMVILYLLVTNPGPTEGFTARLGDLVHKLSSTSPLFQAVPAQSS